MIGFKIAAAIVGCLSLVWGIGLSKVWLHVAMARKAGMYKPVFPPRRLDADPQREGSIGGPAAAIMFIAIGVFLLYGAGTFE